MICIAYIDQLILLYFFQSGSLDQSVIIGSVVGVSAILLTFLLITLFLR